MSRDDWRGLFAGTRPSGSDLKAVAGLDKGKGGSSAVFLVRASDGRRYWVKPLNSPQGERVAATEQIVAHAGALIDAPVCETRVIDTSPIDGWQMRANRTVAAGLAHASLAVPDAVEERGLGCVRERTADDNAVRHVGYFALWDWCWGADAQALWCLTEDRAFYSHDHGHFLPGGPRWTETSVSGKISDPHEFSADGAGLDMMEVDRVATALEQLTRPEIRDALSVVPATWPVSDSELETVGHFLGERAPDVAGRLRTRFGGGHS